MFIITCVCVSHDCEVGIVLARDAFVRTNRRAIAIMFVRLSVRPSVCLGRACIVIIRAR